jgi:hypothetical protein
VCCACPHLTSPIHIQMLIEYVEGVLGELQAYEKSTGHGGIDLLIRYRDSFENYSTGMKYGSELFKYLDRQWINTNHCDTGKSPREGVYYVYEMSLMVWKEVRDLLARSQGVDCCTPLGLSS